MDSSIMARLKYEIDRRTLTPYMEKDSEVDVPLNYADYYFLEALYRMKTAEGGR